MRRTILALSAISIPVVLLACGGGGGTTTGSGGKEGTGGATASSSSSSTTSSSSSTTTSSSSSTTTSSSSSGTGGSGPFSCVGSVTWPAPTQAMVTVPYTFNDAQASTPTPSVNIKTCAKTDTTCAAPLGMGTTDANGKVSLTVPTGTAGFDGYFDCSDTMSKYVPTLFYPTKPLVDATPESGVLVATSTFSLLGSFVAAPDASRGHLTLAAFDCADMSAAGVSFKVDTADAMTTTAYINGALPDKTATKTDSSGACIIVNVPAGPAVVTATLAATNQVVGTYHLLIRAGHVTAKGAPPTPAGGG